MRRSLKLDFLGLYLFLPSFLLPLLLAVSAQGAWADFSIPPLTGPVVDGAGMFSSGTKTRLDSFLRGLAERGSTQLQVATLPDLGGLSIEEASIKIVDAWKLGTAKADNGILLLFAAKERRVRIEVGQGKEGDIPDVIASRIIREVIVPRMREGSPDQAVMAAVMAIVGYTDPRYLRLRATHRRKRRSARRGLFR
ncbi:MAG: TPM domain-containing protein [Calothrix sp. SM1_5_4]|nr:TPM domain-containing protein [Calothrix sp. SM1_5_4]